MNHNLLPSDRAAIAGVINPTSQSAGALSTGWVSMATFASVMAVVVAGALGTSATLDAKLQQASDSSGTGVKDITGKAITQLTDADTDDNKQAIINCRAEELDIANGFTHVRLTMTVATAASLTCGLLIGFDAHYAAASDNDATTVDEIVA